MLQTSHMKDNTIRDSFVTACKSAAKFSLFGLFVFIQECCGARVAVTA